MLHGEKASEKALGNKWIAAGLKRRFKKEEHIPHYTKKKILADTCL